MLEPVNSDKTAPSLSFTPPRGSGPNSVGALYSYVTINGAVLHGSKINVLLWAVFGRYWGYSTTELQAGAEVNEFFRKFKLDKDSSQAAITLGGHCVDVRENQGISTLLQEMQDKSKWKPLVDPRELIEEKLWPSKDAADDSQSTLERPALPTTP